MEEGGKERYRRKGWRRLEVGRDRGGRSWERHRRGERRDRGQNKSGMIAWNEERRIRGDDASKVY